MVEKHCHAQRTLADEPNVTKFVERLTGGFDSI